MVIAWWTSLKVSLHDLCLWAVLAYPHLFLQRYVRLALWEKDHRTKEAPQVSVLLQRALLQSRRQKYQRARVLRQRFLLQSRHQKYQRARKLPCMIPEMLQYCDAVTLPLNQMLLQSTLAWHGCLQVMMWRWLPFFNILQIVMLQCRWLEHADIFSLLGRGSDDNWHWESWRIWDSGFMKKGYVAL